MHTLAAKHAETRAEIFFTAMKEFSELSPDNRPVVSPLGVLIAEMVALVSIVRAQTAEYKEQAARLNNAEFVEFFAKAEKQAELASYAIQNIALY
jgi:hypothetical protein